MHGFGVSNYIKKPRNTFVFQDFSIRGECQTKSHSRFFISSDSSFDCLRGQCVRAGQAGCPDR